MKPRIDEGSDRSIIVRIVDTTGRELVQCSLAEFQRTRVLDDEERRSLLAGDLVLVSTELGFSVERVRT